MPSSTSSRFFNHDHAVQGLSILASVSAMLAVIFVLLDIGAKGHLEVVAIASAVLTILFGCATSAVAKSKLQGIEAILIGSSLGSGFLFATCLFNVAENIQNVAAWIIFLACGVAVFAQFFVLNRLRALSWRSNPNLEEL